MRSLDSSSDRSRLCVTMPLAPTLSNPADLAILCASSGRIRNQCGKYLCLDSRQEKCLLTVVEKRLPCQRDPSGDDLVSYQLCISPNLGLSILVHTDMQEMQQIMQIDFPIRLDIG